MARVWTTGFESGSSEVTSGGTASTVQKRSGSYALRITNLETWSNNLPAPLSEYYFRSGWFSDGMSQYTEILHFKKGSTDIVKLKPIATSLKVEAYVGSTLVGTSTRALAINTWYLVEVHHKMADAGGILQVKIDGVLEIDFSGDTKPGADTTVDGVSGGRGTSGKYDYFDDVALNDTTGAVDNSWCGEGRVIALVPSGAGSATELTPNTGANYAAVDERPKDDDTTYVYHSTVDRKDLYALGDCGLANVAISRVWVELWAKETAAEGGRIAARLKSGGSEYAGADQALGLSYARYVEPWLTNPADSAAWEPADLDALEAGVTVR